MRRGGGASRLKLLAPGAALGLWMGLGALLLGSTLPPERKAAAEAALGDAAGSLVALAVVWWLIGAGLGAWVLWRRQALWEAPAARLAAAARISADDPAAPPIAAAGAPGLRALAGAVEELAEKRRTLQTSLEARVREASAAVAHERDQLAALMAELQQSVVVCNLDGRILLYNERARALMRRISRAPGGSGGAELIGLGRSIHGVIDPARLQHARESVERRLARGEAAVSARFVAATEEGRLLQVGMAPVRPGGSGGSMTGFVLMFDDITEDYAAHSGRDRRLQELIEGNRASFASLQAALDMLDYPDLEAEERESFQSIIREEVTAMSGRLERVASAEAQEARIRWPLQDMLGADLLAAAARRIEADHGLSVAVAAGEEELWLRVDSFALIEALSFLAGRLAERMESRPEALLRLTPAGGRAHLDLLWSGEAAEAEALSGWQTERMKPGDGFGAAVSVREVAERHDGEIWLERDRKREQSFFRFLLPLASGEAELAAGDSRPEFYDFDLFAASEGDRSLDDRPLAGLDFTVFDTETTGLNPSQGDEIIQIGAARIVNGKLLRGDRYEQLVDPQRDIPEAGIPIHGVTPDMVRGQPTIAQALPAFHAFAADTVLVGHNAAFDMRFLALKEAATGLRFDQPVLDTLLLSSVLHPEAESHSLEEIAKRLGVTISGRHTAAGDALATAEVFLKLLPLLRQKGIETLGQARAASQESYYARLRY